MEEAVRYERASAGQLAAWISARADRNLLRRCSDVLVADFGAEPRERFDGMDQLFWDYSVAGVHVVLHLHAEQGLAVQTPDASTRSQELVRRIAEHLKLRVCS